MATSISNPGLVTAVNEAVIRCAKQINIIKLFANDMSEEFEFSGTVKVPVVTAGDLSAFGADNDFENDSGSITYIPVALTDTVKTTFAYTGAEKIQAPNSPYVDKVAQAMADKADAWLSQKVGGAFLSSEITADYTIGTVNKSNIAKLRAQCPGRVADYICGLDSTTYNEVLATLDSSVYGDTDPILSGVIKGLYGFKAVVELKDLPNGIKGALIPTNAIAVAVRAIPVADESAYTEYGTVAGDAGFPVTLMKHFSARTGKGYINLGFMAGVKLLNKDDIVLLK